MWEEKEGVMLLFWSASIVVGRVVRWKGGKGGRLVNWEGVTFLVLFKGGERRVSRRFGRKLHLRPASETVD